MNIRKKRFRVYGEVPALNRKIDKTIEARSPIEARNLMEKNLQHAHNMRRISVSYCLVEEVEENIA